MTMHNNDMYLVLILRIKYLLMIFIINLISFHFVESSYSDGRETYHRRIRSMESFKLSHLNRVGLNPRPPRHNLGEMTSRVYHVTDYGADPSGRSDSTEALERAIRDAFQTHNDEGSHLMEGIRDLGGAQLHLDGGTYKISRPLRLPNSGAGNLMIHGGSLYASNNFPTKRHLIEIGSTSTSKSTLLHEDITLRDLMINSNFLSGGISIVNSIRTIIDNCYVTHFTSEGILIKGGHETYVRNSFIGQHINVGGDHRERQFSGIGINIIGNDNAVTDVVVFSASVGIMVIGQANVFTGVHFYNKASILGGTGIYIRAPGLTQTRVLNCYFDFTGIVAEDPVQLHVSCSFFLGNAFVMLKSLNGVVSGVNVVDNMFSGDYTGVEIVQLDESKRAFASVDQVVVERNSARGMVMKSTVGRAKIWRNGTIWTVDFSPVLLFPDRVKSVQYTLHAGETGSFPRHVLRSVERNRVTVESDVAVSATLHMSVNQNVIISS